MPIEREPVVIVASAEFVLKSYPVRRTLEQRLIDDLRVALARGGFDAFWVEKYAARLVVHGLPESATGSAAECCSNVFGVAYAVAAVSIAQSMKSVLDEAVHIAQTSLKRDQSFAVRCHRSMESALERREIEINGGSAILQTVPDRNIRVDLKNPDLTISIDLAGDQVFIYGNKINGPGGLPLSSKWKMLTVLDSGPLTILAAYAMMRRGCMVELLIPLSKRIAEFRASRQLELATKLRSLVTRSAYKAFTIQIDSLGGQRIEDYRDARMLILAAAVRIAKKEKCRGIILPDLTGNLDTLQNEGITSNDANAALPAFHPLIGLDLKDLLEFCKDAGLSEDGLLSQLRSEHRSSRFKKPAMPIERPDELPVEEMAL